MLALSVPRYTVPSVFDGIIGSAQNNLRNLCPSVLLISLKYVEGPGLLARPVCLLEERAELVVPSLATLLPCAAWHTGCNCLPVAGARVRNQLHKKLVLVIAPGTL